MGRYTVHSSLRKNVECNLLGVLTWTEVVMQVRTDAAAHLHGGDLHAHVTTGPRMQDWNLGSNIDQGSN